MKILYITNNYPTKKYPIYGIFVKEQIKSLEKFGVSSNIIFINGRENGKIEYVRNIFKIRRQLNNKDYDLIHCHHAFSGILLLISFVAFKKKKIITYQNPPKYEGGYILFFILRKLFDRVIIKSNYNELSKFKNISYIPNGVDLDLFKPRNKENCRRLLNLSLDKKYLLFADSNNKRKQKRLDRFKKILNNLTKLNYKVDSIVLIGCERKLMPLYICACDIHIITSDYEGSPNTVKECMASNVPVVSTPVGNVKYLLSYVKNSFVSNSFSDIELTNLVIKMFDNEFSNGRKNIKEKKLDMDSIAKNILKLYNKII